MTTFHRRLAGWGRVLVLAASALAGAVQAQSIRAEVDPPGRVARLSEVSGQVWLYSPESGEWLAASRNQPLTSGDRLATDAGARAELQIGSTSIRLDVSSEVEVVRLDDEQVTIELHDGSAIARVRDTRGAGQLELMTDEGRFIALRDGSYRLDRDNGRSDITVYDGVARYEGPNSGLELQAGQRAEFWIDSGGVAQYSTMAPLNDAFAAWSNDRDRRFAGAVAERYVSPEMTGAAELDAYGRWEQTPDYGSVWIPTTVAAGWAPYSQGRWTWVRPWGWTWVDDAPWGFAPFHYGRWVYLRNNWCWTPGTRVARPVYAPALVGWVGAPRGNVSVTIGGPAVGWFPLAPREVYVPSYRVSPRYARNVNITNVTNVTVINNVFANPQGPREFQNRHLPRAITVVPSNVMAERRPVGPAAAQYRLTSDARQFANQPGRSAALLAPPVSTPSFSAGVNDRRLPGPPPGARPDAGERAGFAGRPGFPPKDRDRDRDRSNEAERDRDRRGAPPSTMPMPQVREPERGGIDPRQRPPVLTTQPALQNGAPNPMPNFSPNPAQPIPAAVPPSAMPPGGVRPGMRPERDDRRSDERFPGRFPRDREVNERDQRPPIGQSRVQPQAQPQPQPQIQPQPQGQPPIQPQPQTQSPQQPPITQRPSRPTIAPPPALEDPMMRALPVQRGEDRRIDERRPSPRSDSPRSEAPRSESPRPSPGEQRAQPSARIERPAAPMAPAPQLAAPRSAEPPRAPAPVAAPMPSPRAEQQRPQRPDDQKRGDQR